MTGLLSEVLLGRTGPGSHTDANQRATPDRHDQAAGRISFARNATPLRSAPSRPPVDAHGIISRSTTDTGSRQRRFGIVGDGTETGRSSAVSRTTSSTSRTTV